MKFRQKRGLDRQFTSMKRPMKSLYCSFLLFLLLNKRAQLNCDKNIRVFGTKNKNIAQIAERWSSTRLPRITDLAGDDEEDDRPVQPYKPTKMSKITRQRSISRQFTTTKKKPRRSTVQRLFQISLLMLTVMAFGTYVMSLIMRNVRLNAVKNPQSSNKIVINMLRPAEQTVVQQQSPIIDEESRNDRKNVPKTTTNHSL